MNTLLYIGNEQCLSFEQLNGYFLSVNFINDVYWDLLDYGKNGELSEFLQEIGELEKADELNLIDTNLDDSFYFKKMATIILGREMEISLKHKFSDCFSIEAFNGTIYSDRLEIKIQLKTILSVKETFQIVAKTDWGTRAITVTPDDVKEGKSLNPIITIKKRPGKSVGRIAILFDDEERECVVKYEEKVEAKNESSVDDEEYRDFMKELQRNNAPDSIVDLARFLYQMDKSKEKENAIKSKETEKTTIINENGSFHSKVNRYSWQTDSYLKKIEEDKKAREQREIEKTLQELERLEEERKRQEAKEREAMIEKWRRKHGK